MQVGRGLCSPVRAVTRQRQTDWIRPRQVADVTYCQGEACAVWPGPAHGAHPRGENTAGKEVDAMLYRNRGQWGAVAFIVAAFTALGGGYADPDGRKAGGQLAVFPSQYNFGSVDVGNISLPLVVTIENSALGETIEVTDIVLSDTTNFSLDVVGCGSRQPVLPGPGSCDVEVSFHPQSAGSYNETLTILTVSAEPSVETVFLSGKGVATGDDDDDTPPIQEYPGCRGVPGAGSGGLKGGDALVLVLLAWVLAGRTRKPRAVTAQGAQLVDGRTTKPP